MSRHAKADPEFSCSKCRLKWTKQEMRRGRTPLQGECRCINTWTTTEKEGQQLLSFPAFIVQPVACQHGTQVESDRPWQVREKGGRDGEKGVQKKGRCQSVCETLWHQ